MTLRLWEPMREVLTLREAMDRMFEDAVVRAPGGRQQSMMSVPLEIEEQDEKVIVRAPVPGFEADQIEISVQGDVLSLRGTQEETRKSDSGGTVLQEWRSGSFQRVVQLPSVVDSDKATATCRSGILTIELPKVTEQITRKISVKAE